MRGTSYRIQRLSSSGPPAWMVCSSTDDGHQWIGEQGLHMARPTHRAAAEALATALSLSDAPD